jgi:outer membrane lipoprotein-sorting protein
VERLLEREGQDRAHWTLAQSDDLSGGGESPSVRLTFHRHQTTWQLQSWVITDPTGTQTHVTLNNVKMGHPLDAKLFEKPTLEGG